MKTIKPLRAVLAVAILTVTGAAFAQTASGEAGKSTSATRPNATPVIPGAPGHPIDEAGYKRYWSALDANGDGKVTRKEYLAYYGKRYDSGDTMKRGYYDQQTARDLYLEREMSKTDGQVKGDVLNPTTKK